MRRRTVLCALTFAALGNTLPAAGQTWSSNPPPPASTYDRYGQPVAPGAPSITQRTQNAFTDTSSAVRDGVEAGIRAAEQGFNNITSQSTNPFATSTASPATASSARSGVSSPWQNSTTSSTAAAPAWPTTPGGSAGTAMSRTAPVTVTPVDGGWTTIGNSVAAPPLLVPQSSPTATGINNMVTSAGRSAASTPSVAANNTQPLHSVLADPSRPSTPTNMSSSSANASDSWAAGWSDPGPGTAATIGRGTTATAPPTAARDTGFAPLPTAAGATISNAGTTTNGRPDAWPESNPWAQPSQPALGAPNGATVTARPTTGNEMAGSTAATTMTAQPSNVFADPRGLPAANGQPSGVINTAATNPGGFNTGNVTGTNLQQISRGQTQTTASTEPQPWMPLVASVLVLAGSLAANLYLGVSYLDARQKYQSLVRKTADTFRRVKAVAA